MNTKIDSPELEINLGVKELIAHYSNPASFKELMPPEVVKFEANESSFLFALKGMPEVRLKVEEISEEQVLLKSSSDKIPFLLRVRFEPFGDKTKAQLHFEGNFNPMLKLMVQRPLNSFVNHLADNMQKIH